MPRWCAVCSCSRPEEVERVTRRLVFYDHDAVVMPGARCQAHLHGRRLDSFPEVAGGDGAVIFSAPKDHAGTLLVEWAPSSLPLARLYPYRVRYFLDVQRPSPHHLDCRLHNLGLTMIGLPEKVRAFQRLYGLAETGDPADVQERVVRYYDALQLEPVKGAPRPAPSPTVPPPPNPAPVIEPKGRMAAFGGAPTARSVGAPPVPLQVPPGNPHNTPIAPLTPFVARVRVRDSVGRPVQGATVTVSTLRQQTSSLTDAQGEALATSTAPDPLWVITVARRHHGPHPDPGASIAAGPVNAVVAVDDGGLSEEQPLLVRNASLPGITVDGQRRLLEVVLIDAFLATARESPAVPTRGLTVSQVTKELLHLARTGAIELATPLVFEHDRTGGDFDSCTSQCRLASPPSDHRVALLTPKMHDVEFFLLGNRTRVRDQRPTDVHVAQRHLEDAFNPLRRRSLNVGGQPTGAIRFVDQRHVVGLARFSRTMRDEHQIAAVYHIGVDGDQGRADNHGHGLAIDFGGFSKQLPDAIDGLQTVRMGIDFHVFFHWGRVAMFDPNSVRQNPTAPGQWQRFNAGFDDGTDYRNFTPAQRPLKYRLDPPPYQNVAITTTDAELATRLARIAPHFVEAGRLFRAAYDFFVREYADTAPTTVLPPAQPPQPIPPPTPIDSHDGHFLIHPDYSSPDTPNADDGRNAHSNHIHAQLGPTRYARPRRT